MSVSGFTDRDQPALIDGSGEVITSSQSDGDTFLIDSNCLITPHNDYYQPKFLLSAPFWDRLHDLVESHAVIILNVVRNEVYETKMKDELNQWLESLVDYIVVETESQQVIDSYRSVINYVHNGDLFSMSAASSWDREGIADPWLIASAMFRNSTIVTWEKWIQINQGQPAAKCKIPNVASHFKVDCMNLFQFMNKVGGF